MYKSQIQNDKIKRSDLIVEKISVFAVISCRVTPLSAHCPAGRINCIKSRGCSCTSKFSSLSHPLDRSPNDFWLVNCADTKDPGIDCEALLTSYTLSFPARSAHSHLCLAATCQCCQCGGLGLPSSDWCSQFLARRGSNYLYRIRRWNIKEGTAW